MVLDTKEAQTHWHPREQCSYRSRQTFQWIILRPIQKDNWY